MTNIIGIVSGKGGTGTTTAAINLGCALTSFGRDCVVVDADLRKPNVGVYLGSSHPQKTIHGALEGTYRIHESAYLHSSGLKVILGQQVQDPVKMSVKSDTLKETVFSLVGATEAVLIDCGNGLTQETKHAILSIDKLIVVVEADLVSVMETLKIIQYAKEQSVPVLGMIINKHHDDGINLSVENVLQMLQVPLLGVIPFDHDVRRSQHLHHPVCYSHQDARASVSFKKIAAQLIGQTYEETLEKKEKVSVFTFVLHRLGLSIK